jgi:hypothetical protein
MTTEELIAYYVALLIVQFSTMPNAAATIAAFVGELINNQIIAAIGDGFNFALSPIGPTPDSAIGVQLEAVAAYRGAQRVYFGLANNSYFQFADAGATPPAGGYLGFMDALVGPAPISWLFATAQDSEQPLYALTDNELYRLTQLRAMIQSMPLTIQNIDNVLYKFFGNNVALIDNGNMTIYYVDLTTDTDPLFGIASISGSLPHSAGVLAQAFRADMLTNFFGLQDALTAPDSSFAGFSDALTAPTVGTFISAA